MKKIKNVLMIVSDDLRPELNCFGKQKLHTPNLDRLAGRGVCFSRAYCNYPQCMPSRTSVMTGLRPHDWVSKVDQLATNGEPTLPAHLRQHGMKTMTVGKVYHETLDDVDSWDHFDRSLIQPQTNGGRGRRYADYQLPENIEKNALKAQFGFHEQRRNPDLLPPLFECADVPERNYIDHQVASRAIEWIEEHAGSEQGLFLAVGMSRPHLPWTAPKRYWDLYQRDEIDVAANPFFPKDGVGKSDLVDLMVYSDPEVQERYSDFGRYEDDDFPVLSEAKQRELIHAYWASVSLMDAQVGRLLDALEDNGMTEETAILFWGDNGFHLGEHKLWTKVTHFDESTRVPVIVSLPNTPQGRTSDEIVELVDIYPTICKLLGVPEPEHLHGVPFPMEEDEKGKGYALVCMSNGHTKMESHSLVTDRHRYTEYQGFDPMMMISGRGHMELFDHATDPAENINVAREAAYESVVSTMTDQLGSLKAAY